MNADVVIREAISADEPFFIDMAVKLSEYNRKHHRERCRYDNFNPVLDAIRSKAGKTFISRNENLIILMAALNNKPVGYALGRIYQEAATADNGTGRTGLLDELFIDDKARGIKLGQQLLEAVMLSMKQKGIHRVKLHCYSWNTTAINLYERNGFTEYALSFEKFI